MLFSWIFLICLAANRQGTVVKTVMLSVLWRTIINREECVSAILDFYEDSTRRIK